jgi:transposase-like protein
MILSAIAERLKRRSKDDFKGRHFEASMILQGVSWYLRYPLSYRDIEELFLERGLAVDHSTLTRNLRQVRRGACQRARAVSSSQSVRSPRRFRPAS